MSVLWIIERAGCARPITRSLQGDFAVRVFATAGSFATLTRFARGPLPDLILVHVEGESDLADELLDAETLPTGAPVLFLYDDEVQDPSPRALPERHSRSRRPEDDLHLSNFIRELIRVGGRMATRLRYRDLSFDFTKLELKLHPDLEAVALPLKEAQLLKYFLEHPGACLTREAICAAIWGEVKVTARSIDSHVSRLRKKLSGSPIGIQSVYGGGYVFK